MGPYSNAIQGRRGACVLVHKGLVDSEVAQLVKAAAGVLRLAEGADLHKYGFRRDSLSGSSAGLSAGSIGDDRFERLHWRLVESLIAAHFHKTCAMP